MLNGTRVCVFYHDFAFIITRFSLSPKNSSICFINFKLWPWKLLENDLNLSNIIPSILIYVSLILNWELTKASFTFYVLTNSHNDPLTLW